MGDSITSLPFLVRVAYLVLSERFLLRQAQVRVVPRVIGFFGLLQTLIDRRKLFLKKFFGYLFFRALFFTLRIVVQRLDIFWIFLFFGCSGIMLIYISYLNFSAYRTYSLFRQSVLTICFDVLFRFIAITIFYFLTNSL